MKGRDATAAQEHQKKGRALVHVFRPHLGKIQSFFHSGKTLKEINKLFNFHPDINVIGKSRKIYIKRTGTKFQTEYEIAKVGTKHVPITIPEEEWPDLVAEIKEVPSLDPEQAAKVLKLKFGAQSV
jgi:hypothetical protein